MTLMNSYRRSPHLWVIPFSLFPYFLFFHFISGFLVQPSDAVRYFATQSVAADRYVASGFHDSYWIFNIHIGAISGSYSLDPSSLIILVNIVAIQLSAFLLINLYDTFRVFIASQAPHLFPSRRPILANVTIITLSPLFPPSFAWIPYNLKDCQVIFFSSLMLFSASTLVLRLLFKVKLRIAPSLLIIALCLTSLFYSFGLRSYQIVIVLLIGLLSPLILSINPENFLRPSKRLLLSTLVILLSTFLLVQLNLPVLTFIKSLLQEISFSFSASFVLDLANFLITPLPFLSSITDYILLSYTALVNVFLWLFYYRRLVSVRDLYAWPLFSFVLVVTLSLSMPYVLSGLQMGPRYRSFSDFNMYLFAVYFFFHQRKLFSLNTDHLLITPIR